MSFSASALPPGLNIRSSPSTITGWVRKEPRPILIDQAGNVIKPDDDATSWTIVIADCDEVSIHSFVAMLPPGLKLG